MKGMNITMKNVFLIGAGNRTYELFIKPLLTESYDNSKIIGIYDINPYRSELLSSLAPYCIPVYYDLDSVIGNSNINIFIILTPDYTHTPLICKLLQHKKASIMCEKPLCITLEQINILYNLTTEQKKRIHILLNSRFMPVNIAIKQILDQGKLGKPLSICYNWNIDLQHGLEYFRRWHSDIEKSGGMLVHKSSHHFDLLNWWLEDSPQLVSGIGRKSYFVSDILHGKNCRECLLNCVYRIDLTRQPFISTMYFNAENLDNYIRDKCIYENVSVNDTLCSQIVYQKGTIVSYTINFYAPVSSWFINIIGVDGSLNINYNFNVPSNEIIITTNKGKKIPISIQTNTLKHSGADLEIRKLLFLDNYDNNTNYHIGSFYEGLSSSLIGILSNCSIKEGKTYVNEYIENN